MKIKKRQLLCKKCKIKIRKYEAEERAKYRKLEKVALLKQKIKI
jgi:hypothetical protein